MTDPEYKPCAWCEALTDSTIVVEAAKVRKGKRGAVVIEPEITAPICDICRVTMKRYSPARMAAKMGAHTRYWTKRQGELF